MLINIKLDSTLKFLHQSLRIEAVLLPIDLEHEFLLVAWDKPIVLNKGDWAVMAIFTPGNWLNVQFLVLVGRIWDLPNIGIDSEHFLAFVVFGVEWIDYCADSLENLIDGPLQRQNMDLLLRIELLLSTFLVIRRRVLALIGLPGPDLHKFNNFLHVLGLLLVREAIAVARALHQLAAAIFLLLLATFLNLVIENNNLVEFDAELLQSLDLILIIRISNENNPLNLRSREVLVELGSKLRK